MFRSSAPRPSLRCLATIPEKATHRIFSSLSRHLKASHCNTKHHLHTPTSLSPSRRGRLVPTNAFYLPHRPANLPTQPHIMDGIGGSEVASKLNNLSPGEMKELQQFVEAESQKARMQSSAFPWLSAPASRTANAIESRKE